MPSSCGFLGKNPAAKVQRYKGNTLYWMNLAPTLATVFLAWVAVSQVVVMWVAARTAFRPGSDLSPGG